MAPRKTKTVKEKADAAEQRSSKTPKSQTTKGAVGAKAEKATPSGKSNDDVDRGLFLDYLPKVAEGRKKIADATSAIRLLYKQAKSDGFTKADFDEAIKMQGAEGEKVKRDAIKRSLKIARWLGMDLGTQLDMFEEPSRVPAVDRAFEEGKTQGLAGITAKTDYSPETEQYRRYMEGWHAGQDIRSKGFKKLHPEVAKDEADKAAKKAQREAAQAEDAKAFDPPASGVAMTRSQFNAQKEQGQQQPN